MAMLPLALAHEFAQQNLNNTAWALSTLFMRDGGPLLDAISSWCRPVVRQCIPLGLAGIAWSYAALTVLVEPLL
eukprot:NODE_12467_length_1223_cov_2.855839.p6 GENE.NODE_12467_length_1223_cov_2.855839~~NODE_12467_length_1223_cov_2.855839.p6  ORF type:complete len:74 (+),score=11.93 NODE_12467_length_1223_cov_2.855839:269-490(+)